MNVDLLIKENKELSEEKQRYKEMWFTANNSLAKYRKLEEGLDCSVETMVAVFKAIQQGFIFADLGNGLYRENNISLNYEDISEDEEGYIGCSKSTNYHYILDYDGCIFVEDYKKTWWLREDKSE